MMKCFFQRKLRSFSEIRIDIHIISLMQKFPEQLGKKQFKPPQPMIGLFVGTEEETIAFNVLIKNVDSSFGIYLLNKLDTCVKTFEIKLCQISPNW